MEMDYHGLLLDFSWSSLKLIISASQCFPTCYCLFPPTRFVHEASFTSTIERNDFWTFWRGKRQEQTGSPQGKRPLACKGRVMRNSDKKTEKQEWKSL
jgi:hypothetical protein